MAQKLITRERQRWSSDRWGLSITTRVLPIFAFTTLACDELTKNAWHILS